MASHNTIEHVENTEVRSFLLELNQAMKKKCLFSSSRRDPSCGPMAQKDHFHWSYNSIFYGVYGSVFSKYNLDYKTIYTSLLPVVLKYQFHSVVQHIHRSIIYIGMHGLYFSYVLFFLFIAAVRLFYKNDDDISRWALFLSLIHIANLIFISLCISHYYRYMFYTEMPLLMTLFGFSLVWLEGQEEEKILK